MVITYQRNVYEVRSLTSIEYSALLSAEYTGRITHLPAIDDFAADQ